MSSESSARSTPRPRGTRTERRDGARPWLATAQVEIADVLVTRNRAGDTARANNLLEACLVACDELGMPELAKRAHTVLERLASVPDAADS
jgi:hypothetical protein